MRISLVEDKNAAVRHCEVSSNMPILKFFRESVLKKLEKGDRVQSMTKRSTNRQHTESLGSGGIVCYFPTP